MVTTFEQTFIDEHAGRVRRYHRMADRAMVQFLIVRLGVVIGSAALPALTALQDHSWLIATSFLVAVLAGLDTQFQWGTEWQHFRSTELALEQAKREYLRQKDLADKKNDPAEQSQASDKNFNTFYQKTEALLEEEAQKFWRFRLTKLQTAEH